MKSINILYLLLFSFINYIFSLRNNNLKNLNQINNLQSSIQNIDIENYLEDIKIIASKDTPIKTDSKITITNLKTNRKLCSKLIFNSKKENIGGCDSSNNNKEVYWNIFKTDPNDPNKYSNSTKLKIKNLNTIHLEDFNRLDLFSKSENISNCTKETIVSTLPIYEETKSADKQYFNWKFELFKIFGINITNVIKVGDIIRIINEASGQYLTANSRKVEENEYSDIFTKSLYDSSDKNSDYQLFVITDIK